MKVRFERDGIAFEYEQKPMPPERFKAVCKLAGAAIGGTVFLVALWLVGVAAIFGALAVLAVIGVYKLAKNI